MKHCMFGQNLKICWPTHTFRRCIQMSCRRAFSVLRRHLVPPNKNERPVPVVLAFSKLSNQSNNNNLSQLESALKSSFVDNSDIELSIIEIDRWVHSVEATWKALTLRSSKDLLETLTTLTKQTPPVLISVDMKILAGLKFLESRPLDGFVAITPPDFDNRNDVCVGKLERPVCDLLVFSRWASEATVFVLMLFFSDRFLSNRSFWQKDALGQTRRRVQIWASKTSTRRSYGQSSDSPFPPTTKLTYIIRPATNEANLCTIFTAKAKTKTSARCK